MDKARKVHIAERTILLSPLFVAFAWMGYLVLNAGAGTNEAFSPSRIDGLVTALFAFIIAYAIMLAGLFYWMSKELRESHLEHLAKKSK